MTPLEQSIRLAAETLHEQGTEATIVLITDGKDECGGNPVKAIHELAERGIIVKSPSKRGLAEEAPGAYKDVGRIVRVAEDAGLARRVARLTPMICIKG